MDTDRLKSTWKTVTLNGDDVALYFYAHLFVTHPELREMFPLAMDAQRDRPSAPSAASSAASTSWARSCPTSSSSVVTTAGSR